MRATVGKFANGEINIGIEDPARGDDVFIIHPTCANASTGLNVNEAVMELLLLIHTVKLSSAKRITAIIPHFAYARQDRKTEARVPISASAIAQLLVNVGVDRIVTVDLHCGQIQGFFKNTPVNNLSPSREFAHYLKEKKGFKPSELAIVAPDAGAVDRARKLADRVSADRVVTILKRRVQAGKVDSMHIAGDVSGMVAVIVDDMTDTSGTLCKAAEVLKSHGAREVYAMITHGVLTDPACERIEKCDALQQVIVTDTMPQSHNLCRSSKLVVLSLAPLIAECVRRIHNEQAMDDLLPSNFLPAVYGTLDSPEAQPAAE
ncbi:Ribose-phosphate pyrophosphokinase [Diplonema papillatum]|nr:Ribose-phosphate pyrophosphokinase [Diplonema papillatum]